LFLCYFPPLHRERERGRDIERLIGLRCWLLVTQNRQKAVICEAQTHALPDWNAAVILSLMLSPLFKLL
jgi:hypothetical protein